MHLLEPVILVCSLLAPVLLWSVGRGFWGTPLTARNQTRALTVAGALLAVLVVALPVVDWPAMRYHPYYLVEGLAVTALWGLALALTVSALRSSRPRPARDGDRWGVPTTAWLLSAAATAWLVLNGLTAFI